MDLKFEPKNLKFNRTVDSEDLNKNNEEIAYDFYKIYKNLNKQNSKIDSLDRYLKLNNQQLNNNIKELEDKLNSLLENKYYLNFYDSNKVSFGDDLEIDSLTSEEKCFYSPNYNTLMLQPLVSQPKTYLQNFQNEIIVPEDLKINITDNTSGANYIENNIENAFDQNINTAWIREYKYTSPTEVEEVTVELEIKIPKSIITDMSANTVFISPYPENNINILKLEYSPVNSSGYQPIENFNEQKNANNFCFSFSDKPATHFKITLQQKNNININNGNETIFPIGLNNISIYKNKYQETSKAYVKFSPKKEIEKITKIDPITTNNKEDNIEIDIYGIDNHDEETLHLVEKDEIISPNYNKEFWLEIKINKKELISPVLKGIDIQFKPIQ